MEKEEEEEKEEKEKEEEEEEEAKSLFPLTNGVQHILLSIMYPYLSR